MRMAKVKGIYKRGNIYWVCYKGLDGKIIRESSGDSDYREALTLLNKRRRDIDEGKAPQVKKIANYSFSELAEKYMLWMNGRHLSAEVKSYIIRELVMKFGNLPLRNFSTAIVEQFQTDNINKGLKNSTNNKKLNVLKAMFSKAVDWEMVEEDILKRGKKVKLLPEDKRLRFISTEECQDLIHACESHLRPIVVTALNTGMRKAEILNLKWDTNIDLKHGFIMLDKTKNHERREIPINDTLKGVLQGITRRLDVPYVFYDTKTSKRYKSIKRSFATALRRSKIQDFKFHDLRHTFASDLVMSGVDLTTVSSLLGHKSLKMTLRYAHLAPAHLKNAVNILDTAMTGKTLSSQSRYVEAVQ
jgi:integrase